jgi:hypothetical protein
VIEIDSPEYKKVHKDLFKLKGAAALQVCIDCAGNARDWSQIHGTVGDSVEHYEARCRSCHMLYDGPTRGENHWASKLCESDVVEIRALYATGSWTQSEIADIYEVNRRTITQVINRVRWKQVA